MRPRREIGPGACPVSEWSVEIHLEDQFIAPVAESLEVGGQRLGGGALRRGFAETLQAPDGLLDVLDLAGFGQGHGFVALFLEAGGGLGDWIGRCLGFFARGLGVGPGVRGLSVGGARPGWVSGRVSDGASGLLGRGGGRLRWAVRGAGGAGALENDVAGDAECGEGGEGQEEDAGAIIGDLASEAARRAGRRGGDGGRPGGDFGGGGDAGLAQRGVARGGRRGRGRRTGGGFARLAGAHAGGGDNVRGRLTGEEAHGSEAEVLTIAGRDEDGAAGIAHVIVGTGLGVAVVALAEEIGDAGDIGCEGPELAGGGASKDGSAGDLAAGDEFAECLVGATRAEGLLLIAYEPGAHGVLGGLFRERLEEPGAGWALLGVGVEMAAVGAENAAAGRGGGVVRAGAGAVALALGFDLCVS